MATRFLLTLSALVLFSALPTAAYADHVEGPFISLSGFTAIGESELEQVPQEGDDLTPVLGDKIIGLGTGWRFNENFAATLDLHYYPENEQCFEQELVPDGVDLGDLCVNSDGYAISLGARGYIPLSESFELYAGAGVLRKTTNINVSLSELLDDEWKGDGFGTKVEAGFIIQTSSGVGFGAGADYILSEGSDGQLFAGVKLFYDF